jgi:hypothetical protein
MEKITVVGDVITVRYGTVELSDDQAKRRKHNLEHLIEKSYEVKRPIQFKVGETFGYESGVKQKKTTRKTKIK